MTNIYWPVYKNIESELNRLMFNIHIDDNQLNVYSSKISDLILRASTEIESISKELYFANGGTKTGFIKYDDDAIKFLNREWLLDKKVIIISSFNCFQTKRELIPFEKKETRTGSRKLTFSWNNSYQNLKHDRGNSLQFGSVKYLFDALAALFILNVYYSDENFDLGKDSLATSFPIGLGSDVFSVKLAKNVNIDLNGNYKKPGDFDESMYFSKWTDESAKIFNDSTSSFNKKFQELLTIHPKVQEFISRTDMTTYKGNNLGWEALGQQEYANVLRQASRLAPIKGDQLKYEALINKNQI